MNSLGFARFASLLIASVLLGSCGGGRDSDDSKSVQRDDERKAAAAFTPTGPIPADANTRGLWSGVTSWPIIPVHAVLLPDGRVMSYGTTTSGQQTAFFSYDVWNPADGLGAGHTTLANGTATDIFCSSQLVLPDGNSVFIAGGDNWTGTATTNTGNNNSNLLSIGTNTLTRANNMNRARWYSSSITLMNGETYIQGGSSGTDRPEVRQVNGAFRLLSGANTSGLAFQYPRNFVAPDGRVFGYDSDGRMYYVNPTGTGTYTSAGQLSSSYAGNDSSAAMFRPGRILQFGGNSNGAAVIDIRNGAPVVTPTQSMSTQRRLVTGTILPDGTVLATGGSGTWNELVNVNNSAEIWNPNTGTWTLGASGVQARLYHSMALLLPDATVMVGGGGAPGPQNNRNFELYFPPYLFGAGGTLAPRPTIEAAPTVMDIGHTYAVDVASAGSAARVVMVKSGSVTHSWNMEQRFVELPFVANGTRLSVQAPSRAADAPPGFYMLFVLNPTGVPSVAKMVRINVAELPNPEIVPTLTNPGDQVSPANSPVSLQLNGTDPNGDTLSYGATGLPPGLTLNPTTGLISGTPTTSGTYNVVAVVSDGVNSATVNFVWTINASGSGLSVSIPVLPTPAATGLTVSFTASANGTNTRFKWNFGDGTAETAYSTSPTATHAYAQPGLYYVTVTAIDDGGIEQRQTVLQAVHLPLTANRATYSTNLIVQQPAAGNARVWVVNQDNDSVSVFDAVTRSKLAEVDVGTSPRSIAVAPGNKVWVTNKRSSTISVIDTTTFAVTSTIALPRGSQPYGVAIPATGGVALVVLEASGQLLKLNSSTGATLGTVPVGTNPRHLAVTGDGASAYVSRFITRALPGEGGVAVDTTSSGAEVLKVGVAALSVDRTIVIAHGNRPDAENQGRGVPNYLGAAAISPDGSQAWVPSKQDNIKRGTLRDGLPLNFQNTVRAVSSRIGLGADVEDPASRIDHDNASMASAAVYDLNGNYLFVALETSREVAVVDAHGRRELFRFEVGRAPQGLALSADGQTLFVNNFMDRTVAAFDLRPLFTQGVFDVPQLAVLGAVAMEKLPANVLVGKQFFYDARDPRLSRERYMSCASCHNDGGHDGRVWDLTGFGEGLRNTTSLRGRAGAMGALHWSNNFDEVQDFEGQIRTLAGGTGLMSNSDFVAGTRSEPLGDPKLGVSSDLDALAAYVGSLNTFDPSPYRTSTGALSATGVEGRQLFTTLRCASCHSGTAFTRSGPNNPADVGTIKPSSGQRLFGTLAGIDVPTLRDVWATPPYLHDGSAATLEAAVQAHSGVVATAPDLTRIATYLREIGSEELSAPDLCPCTIWPATTTPAVAAIMEPDPVNLGVKFRADQDGFIAGIRFYKGSGNSGTHVGTLWSATGAQLATATFTNESATGWQQVNFATPVPVAANTVYVASYFAPNGGYSFNGAYFTNTGVDNGPLHALQNGVTGGNGVYGYAGSPTFPASSFNSTNYWVDVVFVTTAADTTPPTVTATTPSAGATGVSPTSAMTATFSEAMDAATISGSTVELRNAGGTLIGATVSYNATSRVATLTPTAALAGATSHTLTVRGGASDPRVKDAAGNPLAANATVTFTTAAVDTTPPTVTATTPSAGATGVSTTSAMTATFSEAMSAATISGSTVELRNGGGTLIGATVSYNATTRVVTLTPTAALAGATSHTLTVRGGASDPRVKDVAGNPLAANATVTFTTAAVDTTPPTVTATTPSAGATGVSTTSAMTATFSEAMDAATISGSTVELRNGGGTLIGATVSYNATTRVVTLTPTAALAGATSHTLTVRGGASDPRVKDLTGNALAANATVTFTTGAASGPCSSPANPIVAENCLAGNPASEWDITGAGAASIQGFATQISVNRGTTVSFKVSTDATNYRFDIYRMGYYGGMGARKVATVTPSVTLPQVQPSCLSDPTTGLIDCGNWAVSGSWAVPASAASGIYLAKLVRPDTGGASHIVFIVRDDAGSSDLLFKASDTTWQAYNDYGGNSLYVGSPAGRAYKVSYNRPFVTRGSQYQRAWLFGAEYPMVRWIEANGYNVSYIATADADRSGSLLLNHKVLLSVGHDEYWSGTQRANVEAARNAGVNLAFFSGNEMFWKTRWENSIDGSGTAHRTLVTYKETHAGAKIDPQPTWTGTWRDPRFSPPSDGGRPENALTGTIFTVNCCDGIDGAGIVVPSDEGKLRLWRNTTVASLGAGQSATLAAGTLGYEWDEDLDNGFRPPGLIRMSSTTRTGLLKLQDHGSIFTPGGVATHNLTMYRHSSGARVFSAGTIRWSWGLDVNHDPDSATPNVATTPDARMQQATVNLFADMVVQPGTLQSGLIAASASTDSAAPVSTISSPAAGAQVSGSSVTISGTATDSGGGVVGGVEVSVDGGTTWHPTTGRGAWTYTWAPSGAGTATIRTRATDDSGNLEAAGSGITVTVSAQECPCTIWSSSSVPTTPAVSETLPVNLGVKFRSDVNGFITGVRFYKGPGNTGSHVGTLWSSAGTALASATFTNETASGWQQVNFATPVAVTANTVYVASYLAPNGSYPFDTGYFGTAAFDRPPLHALQNGVSGGNGVFTFGATTTFPTSSFQSTNYWVDVVFVNSIGPDTTPPTVTATTPSAGATGVSPTSAMTATFSEAMDAATISGSTVELRNAGGTLIGATVSYNATTRVATLTPTAALGGATSYTLTVRGGASDPRVKDVAGNPLAANATVTFTTAAVDTTPPTVTATTPSAGATGVSTTSAMTATFSEAMSAATISGSTVELRNGGGTLIGATVSYNATTRVATLTPTAALAGSTSHTLTVRGGASDPRVKDVAGNPLAANATVTFTTAAGPVCPCTIWSAATTPALASFSESTPVNLGVKFRPTQSGYITGIRFYKGTANTGTHVGRLWSLAGSQLATATFTGETATGWQQMNFATPVAVTANTVYVASYFAPSGGYAFNGNYFSASVTNGPLEALQNGASGGNGVFTYGGSPAFPTSSFQAGNYWVDVVFSTTP